MGGYTDRGDAVHAGFGALADEAGDDTLTVPEDQPTGTDGADLIQSDAEQTGEAEETGDGPTPLTNPQGESASPGPESPSPGPADIPAPPVIETADESTADRETRNP